ncbi:helix-turn-helix domain-containing protein [Mycobacterium sp. E2479]|uniref:helix-turn-helix domain-containing protein n=1 Tax=Mycobacterium sp. E2479 TaxID=1834134 RepID=UPI0007FD9D6B|nr:helix-turn-helix domain-containing protein [Mycobacterium sp. E2479]OBH51287.1 hypothetical protein A5686_12300 [Mycobacterium sp. E2479]
MYAREGLLVHDQLLSIPTTQTRLGGVCRRMVYTLIEQGQIKRVKVGSRAFITESSVDSYIARLTETAAS